jgi:hypothetical protein
MELSGDSRGIHHDWVRAGAHVQETVAALSQQLRHYVDENYIAEERRISGLLRSIEGKALSIRSDPPTKWHLEIDAVRPEILLPLDRPLYTSRMRPTIEIDTIDSGLENFSAESLFSQVFVDKEKLRDQITYLLQTQDRISISQVIAKYPLEMGLSELIMYLVIADENYSDAFQTDDSEEVLWEEEDGTMRLAKIPKIIFRRV